jgi:geranylgeranyl pyrophosphate synthase
MNVYQQAAGFLSSMSMTPGWQEMHAFFQSVASRNPAHWLLPLRACEAVGGNEQLAIPAVTAMACAHIGILLVDDMLDADPRGEYQRVGMPAAANLACAFQSAALTALEQGIQEFSPRRFALASFNEMFLSTAYGQFLDVQVPSDEDAYWQIVRTKSSPFFGAAFQVGALAGGASLEVSEQLNTLGRLYGEMIQVHDDLHDVMEVPANPDWMQGRRPLPILFAALVRHPQQARFIELARDIDEAGALEEAQEILIQCGAVSYCVDQLLQRYKIAQTLLDGLPLVQPGPVASLVDSIIAPVYDLLEACR